MHHGLKVRQRQKLIEALEVAELRVITATAAGDAVERTLAEQDCQVIEAMLSREDGPQDGNGYRDLN